MFGFNQNSNHDHKDREMIKDKMIEERLFITPDVESVKVNSNTKFVNQMK